MKKVIIIPGNTDLNRGDQALVWESIHLVEDVYGKDNVECYLMADTESKDAFLQNRQTAKLGYHFVRPLLKHPGRRFSTRKKDSSGYSRITLLRWGLQALIDYCHSVLLLSNIGSLRCLGELLLNKTEIESLTFFKECDAVFVKGGGFIHSYGVVTDSYLMYFLTYHIRLAEANGKKVFVLPNSIGPLKNKAAKRIALKALNRCSLVTVRENISKVFLEEQNVKVEHYPDLGFFLTPVNCDMSSYLNRLQVPLETKKVVITLRPYRFNGHNNQKNLYNNYINSFVKFVEFLTQNSYHVTFMAHTLGPSSHEDDRIALNEVIEKLSEESHKNISYIEDFELNCKEVEKIYSYYDYMIGTRFHSVIFSLNMSVPSIAIAYGGNKGKGIMNVLDSDSYSIDIDKVEEGKLISAFQKLEKGREAYLNNLSQKRKEIDKQRISLIKRIQGLI